MLFNNQFQIQIESRMKLWIISHAFFRPPQLIFFWMLWKVWPFYRPQLVILVPQDCIHFFQYLHNLNCGTFRDANSSLKVTSTPRITLQICNLSQHILFKLQNSVAKQSSLEWNLLLHSIEDITEPLVSGKSDWRMANFMKFIANIPSITRRRINNLTNWI